MICLWLRLLDGAVPWVPVPGGSGSMNSHFDVKTRVLISFWKILRIMYYPIYPVLLVYLLSLVLYAHVMVLKHPMLVGRKIHVMGCLLWWAGWISKPRSCKGCTKARGHWLQRPAASWELGKFHPPGVVKHPGGWETEPTFCLFLAFIF